MKYLHETLYININIRTKLLKYFQSLRLSADYKYF